MPTFLGIGVDMWVSIITLALMAGFAYILVRALWRLGSK